MECIDVHNIAGTADSVADPRRQTRPEKLAPDNGQTWEQVETMDNLNVKLQDTVTIKPGIWARFF